jgi:hypothetical protein
MNMVFLCFVPMPLTVKEQEIAHLEIHAIAEIMELALLIQVLLIQNVIVLE